MFGGSPGESSMQLVYTRICSLCMYVTCGAVCYPWGQVCHMSMSQHVGIVCRYFCYTCGLVDSKGCCSACAQLCHAGHDLVYSTHSRFFCDCGAGVPGSVPLLHCPCMCSLLTSSCLPGASVAVSACARLCMISHAFQCCVAISSCKPHGMGSCF